MDTTKKILTARVSSIQKNLFLLCNGEKEIPAKLKGSFFMNNSDPPVVGDYVLLQYNEYGDSLIESIAPRKTMFVRPNRSGHAEGFVKNLMKEVLVANFDYVFIVSSLNQNFNENRIARYISITLEANAMPVVILSKADLCDEVESYIQRIKALSNKVAVHAVSSKTGYGLEELKQYLKPEITIALLGSSGVGKSTLLNTISGAELMTVNAIRDDDGKGRHTTTHRELFTLSCGTTIIDTPGLREIGLSDVDEGIDDAFSDVTGLFTECRFRNCTHRSEPGCAVLQALSDGTLSKARWNLYQKLHEENEWGKEKSRAIRLRTREMKQNDPKHQRW